MHKLKWSIQRDQLAKMARDGKCGTAGMKGINGAEVGFGAWLESKGSAVIQDGERVRLALCPDIRKIVGFYEQLGRSV